MKRSVKLKTVLAAVLFAAAALAFAEVALDEVVQAGRFVFYRDHADPHRYYYVPDAPRLAAKRDGTPEFTFIKYTKTGGETKGGVVHFLVTWGYTSGELSAAESALKATDPQARIAGPVPFKEGTFQVVSATAGEGGLFNRRIVGEGKAPVLPGQKAAVSIALTEEGASLLWESFKNPTSDVSVLFALKFTGVTPAFQAKLKVDWDKVYTHHDVRVAAEGTIKVVKLKAEMQAILDELRQRGVIQLDVVGENENMQKMLDTVYTHILNMMCEPVPTGGGAPSPPVKAPMAAAALGPPAWSYDVLANFVRASGERLRGGPLWDQEQAQTQRAAGFPCDERSRQNAAALARSAISLLHERRYAESNNLYQQAYNACPDPHYLYEMGLTEAFCLFEHDRALQYFRDFLEKAAEIPGYSDQRAIAQAYVSDQDQVRRTIENGEASFRREKYAEALLAFRWLYDHTPNPIWAWNMAVCYKAMGDQSGSKQEYENAIRCLEALINLGSANPERFQRDIDDARRGLEELKSLIAPAADARVPVTDQAVRSTEEARRARRQEVQAQQQGQTAQTQSGSSGPPTSTRPPTGVQAQEQVLALRGAAPPGPAEGGTRPPAGQDQAAAAATAQAQQQTTAQAGAATPPAAQTPPAKPAAQTPATPPAAAAPEVKPIVSVSLGYTFKRVKMSGRYEVDMRKRLREDRDITMAGNIGGVFQKYGEDKRFFTIVSLDDPTFQERSVEVILDGQDAEDFKNFVNTVTVLFRKQRFSGAPMTGEVKFFADQFAQSGNRLSFRYGRLNEASTEWLTYEYKPKWSFFGGIEWEGEWTKTSDSVLTLAPPVRRRTLEISVDEDNILKNNVKALAVQIRHEIYGKEIEKEVIIDYDKGDPLQARYTYMHEEGSPRYSYKVIWLTTDGREVETDWASRESPFIYAVYARR